MAAQWQKTLERILPAAMYARLSADALIPRAEEIRIRCMKPVQLVYNGGEELIDCVADRRDCELSLEGIAEHSLYAFGEELKSCFVTVSGGCRVGLCGRVRGGERTLTDVTGFNIRIARECRGCADGVANRLVQGERPVSTLVFSAPGVGKTTMLRDIARQFSYGLNGLVPRRVCLADERGELAGAHLGVPELDVGPRTDVMDGCKKAEAIGLMVRAMSPEIVITDELGGYEDARAVEDAAACGVAVIASAHAGSPRELLARRSIAACMESGLFKKTVWLFREGGRVMARTFDTEDI